MHWLFGLGTGDLVDDWGLGGKGSFYWGDKGGSINRGRRTGTIQAKDQVNIPRMDCVYSGH